MKSYYCVDRSKTMDNKLEELKNLIEEKETEYRRLDREIEELKAQYKRTEAELLSRKILNGTSDKTLAVRVTDNGLFRSVSIAEVVIDSDGVLKVVNWGADEHKFRAGVSTTDARKAAYELRDKYNTNILLFDGSTKLKGLINEFDIVFNYCGGKELRKGTIKAIYIKAENSYRDNYTISIKDVEIRDGRDCNFDVSIKGLKTYKSYKYEQNYGFVGADDYGLDMSRDYCKEIENKIEEIRVLEGNLPVFVNAFNANDYIEFDIANAYGAENGIIARKAQNTIGSMICDIKGENI